MDHHSESRQPHSAVQGLCSTPASSGRYRNASPDPPLVLISVPPSPAMAFQPMRIRCSTMIPFRGRPAADLCNKSCVGTTNRTSDDRRMWKKFGHGNKSVGTVTAIRRSGRKHAGGDCGCEGDRRSRPLPMQRLSIQGGPNVQCGHPRLIKSGGDYGIWFDQDPDQPIGQRGQVTGGLRPGTHRRPC